MFYNYKIRLKDML